MQVDAAPCLARDGGAYDVAQAHHKRTFLIRLAHSGEGIGGFSGLGNGDDQIAAADDGIAVAELCCLLHLGGGIGQILEGIFADQAGVQGSATADEHDAMDLGEVARGAAHAGKHGGAEREVEPPAYRVAQGFRLLVNFLQHEVGEAAFFRCAGIEIELCHGAGDGHVVQVADLDVIGLDDGDVVVVEINHALGVSENGGGIGGDDGFSFTDAEHDRTAPSRGDDETGLAGGNDGDAKGAFDLVQRIAYGLKQISLIVIADQMSEHFRIGL